MLKDFELTTGDD